MNAGPVARCERGSPVAVETTGNWYWIVDEIDAAAFVPKLVHARKAKLMLGMINKTDQLDARGLNRLQQTGTLPAVWIPPGDLRDRRDLPRTRIVLVRQRAQRKNRIHATRAKYALVAPKVSDLFGQQGRAWLEQPVDALPPQTAYATRQRLDQVEALDRQVRESEQWMRAAFRLTPEIALLMTLPGIGLTLAVVIALEVGDVSRFAQSDKLAAYASTTPRVHSSGGKDAVRPAATGREPVFEVGARGGGQRDLPAPPAPPTPPRQPTLRAGGAAALAISENTVKNHLKSIMEKLHLANRVQVVAYALREGLVRTLPPP